LRCITTDQIVSRDQTQFRSALKGQLPADVVAAVAPLAVIGAREPDEQPAADIRVKRLARDSETPSGFGGQGISHNFEHKNIDSSNQD
jgi:hypothetical protein